MDTKETFRMRLPYYMKRAGMNQIELAKAVGKSEASVSLWLSGRVFPRIDTIQKIADVLGCQTDDLLIEGNSSMINMFNGAPQRFHPLVAELLDNRIQQETLEEDAKLAALWRTASIHAKRAAITILESMREDKFK